MIDDSEDFRVPYHFLQSIRGDLIIRNADREIRYIGDAHAMGLIQIEAMAREIQHEVQCGRLPTGFVIEGDAREGANIRPQVLARKYYRPMAALLPNYTTWNIYEHSAYVWAVCEAARALGIYPNALSLGHPARRAPDWGIAGDFSLAGKTGAQGFNMLVERVAANLATDEFERRLSSRRRNAQRNLKAALQVERQTFDSDRSGRFVVMLCLGFAERYWCAPLHDEVRKFRTQLLNNRRPNRLLRGIKDYIWRLDEGESTGPYLNVLVFYERQLSCDVDVGKALGDYWTRNVTRGIGAYWHCSMYRHPRWQDGSPTGMGQISGDDDRAREALRGIIRSMAAAEQVSRLNCGDRVHLFGTSRIARKLADTHEAHCGGQQ